MATEKNLYRTEGVVIALNSGNLNPGSWDCDHVLAHGLTGHTTPLGNALTHLLAHPTPGNLWLTVVMVAGILERKGICKGKVSTDVARDALRWWADKRCPVCEGRGIIEMAVPQIDCEACASTPGEKPRPTGATGEAVSLLTQAEFDHERDLRQRLTRHVAEERTEANYVVGVRVFPHDRPDLIPSRGQSTPRAEGCQ